MLFKTEVDIDVTQLIAEVSTNYHDWFSRLTRFEIFAFYLMNIHSINFFSFSAFVSTVDGGMFDFKTKYMYIFLALEFDEIILDHFQKMKSF